jgi:hypothetical protein
MDIEFEKMEQTLRNKASTGDATAAAQLAIFLAVRRFDRSTQCYSKAMLCLASASILISLVQITVVVTGLLRK